MTFFAPLNGVYSLLWFAYICFCRCCSATLRVVSKPGEGFNGVATVTFAADDIASLSSSSPVSSSSSLESDSGLEAKDSEETFDVEYYFCTAGSVWNSSQPEADANSTDACSLCTDLLQQDVEVMTRPFAARTRYGLPCWLEDLLV